MFASGFIDNELHQYIFKKKKSLHELIYAEYTFSTKCIINIYLG